MAHRQCRQDEFMREQQWRLSFSRAEIVLINSWIPVQQIVYHMLRVFVKSDDRLTDSADNPEAGKLSNYHIKTLMLWACELKPKSWWTDDLNLVRICVELLHTLADWLTDARCQHYFIDYCNLIDNSFNVTNIRDLLLSVDKTWLSTWFLNNYIRQSSQLCPDNISRLFVDLSTVMKVQHAVSAVVAYRLNSLLSDLRLLFSCEEMRIALYMRESQIAVFNPDICRNQEYKYPLTARSCVCWMTELAKIDLRLSVYFAGVAFLHVAFRTLRHGLNDELMDILATLSGQFICGRRYSNNFTSSLLLDTAAELMKVVANKSLSTVQLMQTELSKAYLYRALRYKDSDCDSIYCVANVYLAILYYTAGQYQTAIDHCTLVTKSQDHSQCGSHVVQGELLPRINDDVDNSLGLAVFYQHILSVTLNQQQQKQHVSVFTTELLAHYLHTRLASVTQRSISGSQLCAKSISEMHQLHISDLLLLKSLNGTLEPSICDMSEWSECDRSAVSEIEQDTPELIKLLHKSAVERLTKYRQLLAHHFGSVATIVTTDFEALYAYKRGDYQQCLHMCTQNVHMLLYPVFMPNIILTFPEFIQLLDDDIVSLTALTVIVDPNCRRDSGCVCISQLTLSLYLMTQCHLKLRHSVTSLAQALDYIEGAQRIHPSYRILDQLTLKLIERKIVVYVG